jgi:transposase-like protein
MSIEINQDQLDALVKSVAPSIKDQSDLSDFISQLTKNTVEAILSSEMDHHLGYEKHSSEGNGSGNSRNGSTPKKIKTTSGTLDINVPRDRNGSFEPLLIGKHRRRFTALDDHILALFSRGMSTRDIGDMLKEAYGSEVSHTIISKVTDAVIEEVKLWQARPLERIYPVLFLDCIVVKVHQDRRVVKKSVYLALAINMDGHKELLGMWIAQTEGAKFWLSVLNELKNRGMEDTFVVCTDGLTGFPEAVEAAFPHAITQTCIVHLIRNSLKYVPYKDRKAVAADLKTIYQAETLEEAEYALEELSEKWDDRYASVSNTWRRQWERVIPFLMFPPEIRKVIYTTNAIESVNSVIRKATKQRKIFPSDDSVFKTLYLAITRASEKWTMPVRNWATALNMFEIEFADRMGRD